MTNSKSSPDLLEKVISLAKRRGFIFPGSEIYGGLANSWDYGPLGVELKNNIKQLWWKRFTHERDDIVGIDAAIIMNPEVWRASGHLENFSDIMVECKRCHKRFRVEGAISSNKPLPKEILDHIETEHPIKEGVTSVIGFESVKQDFTEKKDFNLMLKTFLGPAEEKANEVYLRPETAQSMFVNFKNVLDTTRKKLPFGIAQIGKAFRNEISPGNFIFRTREFEQMEIEYFVSPHDDWNKHFDYWQNEMEEWLKEIGIKNYELVPVPDAERAHYSKKTIDIEYKFPFGQKELYGLAYRGDFDLKNHFKEAPYRDQETGEEFWPRVIEPTWGVDRTVLAVLLDAYHQDGDRMILKLSPKLAPIKAAVFPLLANKPALVAKAKAIADILRKKTAVAFDDRGNIGKRYYAQDEIGTPWCITVDFQSLEDETVTVRYRDTAKQKRISITEVEQLQFMENMV